MKKISVLLIAFIILISAAGCSGAKDAAKPSDETTAAQNAEEKSEIDLNDIMDKMIADLKIDDASPVDPVKFLEAYGIEESSFSSAACFITTNGEFPSEAIMVEAADEANLKIITEKLETRLNDVKTQSENYNAENHALAMECKVLTNGNYAALFLSPIHGDMEKMFLESVK